MSKLEKLFLSWLCLIGPIYVYGTIEISYLEINIRYLLLGAWMLGVFISFIIAIWRAK